MWKLRSGSRNSWMQIKNISCASHLSNFWKFFVRCDPNYFLSGAIGDHGRNLIISLTWRQSSNQWSGGLVAYPTHKNSKCKNLLGTFSPQIFGIKTTSSLIIFQRVKLSTQSITRLCWCSWRTFWRNNAVGRSPRWSCSCPTMPRLTGHLQPRRNWPACASSVFDHPPYSLDLAPSDYHPFPGLKSERSPFFIHRGGNCCRGDLVGWTTFWIIFEGLAKVRAVGKEVSWASWGVC